jgi:hypothetical protein
MNANSTSHAQAFLSASDAPLSQEVADDQWVCALNTPYIHISWPRHELEASGQIHAPVASYLRKDPEIHIRSHVGETACLCTFYGEENNPFSCLDSNPDFKTRSHSPYQFSYPGSLTYYGVCIFLSWKLKNMEATAGITLVLIAAVTN